MAHSSTPEHQDDGAIGASDSPPESGAQGGRPEPLGRSFHAHLGTVALANLADGILMAGVPLIAVSLTRSPQEISLLTALFWLPWLIFGLIAGVVIDRTDRRRLRILALTVRVAVLLGVVGIAVAGAMSIEVLIVFMGLYGLTQVFADMAGRTMIPQVAPSSRLAAANGRTMAAEQVFNDFIGPPAAGLLVVLGAGWVLGVPTAVCVGAVLVLVFGLRGDYRAGRRGGIGPVAGDPSGRAPAQESGAADAGGFRELFDGIRIVWSHPVLRPVVIMSCVANLATTAHHSVFILWVVGEESAIGLTASQYPLFAVASAVGAIVASFVVEHLKRSISELPLMLGSFLALAPLMLLPVLLPRFDVLLLTGLLQGFLGMTGNVIAMTMIQRLTPEKQLGRVIGAVTSAGFGLMPIGALAGGVVGEHLGLPVVFLSAAVLLSSAVAYPMLRINRRLTEEGAAEHREACAPEAESRHSPQ